MIGALGISLVVLSIAGPAPLEPGPDTVPPLARATEALEGQDPREARGDLLDAVAELSGERETELLALVSLLDRVEAPADRVAARAFLALERGEAREALRIVEEGLPEAREEDRAPLLALAARAGTRVDPERALEFRIRLVEDHPESLEAPEALLTVARATARDPERVEEAVEMLETFIVERPNHPVTPEARRERDRLRERIP